MQKKQSITLPPEAKKRAVASLKRYLNEELEDDVGDLKAELFLRFVVEELGPTIYNKAIADARAYFEERTADLGDVCYQEEFPHSPGPVRR